MLWGGVNWSIFTKEEKDFLLFLVVVLIIITAAMAISEFEERSKSKKDEK